MSGLVNTIRRRGGLALTSRVVGGLWVVGQRTQTSPYNAAATAALKAAFTAAQWATIRDYGWQHPEIVPYVNANPLCAAIWCCYVQDGLVFQMDCNYECTAAKWKDVRSTIEFAGNGSVAIQDGVPYFNGSANMSSSSSVLYSSETCTIEAVFQRGSSNVMCILTGGAANDGNLQLLLNRQGTFHFRNKTEYSAFVDDVSMNFSAVSLNKDRGFLNQVALSRKTNTGADTSVQSYSMIGNRAAGSNLPFIGKLYSIRIYNRLLTEQEILANQAIDLQRWQPS